MPLFLPDCAGEWDPELAVAPFLSLDPFSCDRVGALCVLGCSASCARCCSAFCSASRAAVACCASACCLRAVHTLTAGGAEGFLGAGGELARVEANRLPCPVPGGAFARHAGWAVGWGVGLEGDVENIDVEETVGGAGVGIERDEDGAAAETGGAADATDDSDKVVTGARREWEDSTDEETIVGGDDVRFGTDDANVLV